jgi:hypothetical protein
MDPPPHRAVCKDHFARCVGRRSQSHSVVDIVAGRDKINRFSLSMALRGPPDRRKPSYARKPCPNGGDRCAIDEMWLDPRIVSRGR